MVARWRRSSGAGGNMKTTIAMMAMGLAIGCKPLPERVPYQGQSVPIPAVVAQVSPASVGPSSTVVASASVNLAVPVAVAAPAPIAPMPVAVVAPQPVNLRPLYGPSYHLPNGTKFHGYDCTVDCSGHEAGYQWAEDHGIDDPEDCGGNSNSFIEGCRAYAEEHGGLGAGEGSANDDDPPEDHGEGE
jgi:hypothetical protein